jgi:hypothetical protein
LVVHWFICWKIHKQANYYQFGSIIEKKPLLTFEYKSVWTLIKHCKKKAKSFLLLKYGFLVPRVIVCLVTPVIVILYKWVVVLFSLLVPMYEVSSCVIFSSHVFLMLTILVDLWWYITGVLICVSLMTSDGDLLVTCTASPLSCFPNVHGQKDCLCHYWVVNILYIFAYYSNVRCRAKFLPYCGFHLYFLYHIFINFILVEIHSITFLFHILWFCFTFYMVLRFDTTWKTFLLCLWEDV